MLVHEIGGHAGGNHSAGRRVDPLAGRAYQPSEVRAVDPGQTEELLARIPILSGLEPESRRLFAGLVKIRRYAKRKVVVWEGEPGDALFVVISGFLKAVTASGDGHE